MKMSWEIKNMKLKKVNPFWYALIFGLVLNCVIIPICVTVFVVNNRKNNNEIVMEEKLQEIVSYSDNSNLYSFLAEEHEEIITEVSAALPEEKKYLSTSEIIDKIYEVQANENFTRDDAVSLYYKIAFYAERYGLTLREALTIVNVESDFTIYAHNSKGDAYGLCQVTKPCLEEYNKYHSNKTYTLSQVYDVDVNLNIGFWYYNLILTKYADSYNYITTTTLEKSIRDAYIVYNVGPSTFNKIGVNGRNSLRNGVYPKSMFGCKKGSTYKPILRLYEVLDDWKEVAS